MNWFENWFNADYLRLYPQRDETEAAEQIEAALRWLGSPAGPLSVLDIATGAGRHRLALERSRPEFFIVGVDLSWYLLTSGRRNAGHESPSGIDSRRSARVRADMRYLPFRDATFDLLCCFFTSFGYFESDEEHAALLREWRRVAKPGGKLLLDYLNPEHVVRHLVPESERMVDGIPVIERRRLIEGGRRVEKTISLQARGSDRQYVESVRLFSNGEMNHLLTGAGFRVDSTFGSFEPDGGAVNYSSDSERMIFLAGCTT